MNDNTYKERTADVYNSLFAAYSEKQFDESVGLFAARHRRWGIDLNWFKDKTCLDAGCGGGRFLVALARLGARDVKGIDISPAAVAAANNRLRSRGMHNAEAIEASVLAVPFADNTFNYVVSSGVIHHTPDPRRAFDELVRVLKPDGTLFLSVYGRGGLKWFVNDLFRYTLCKIVPFHALDRLCASIGIPANKRYTTLDNLYVPYCFRFTEQEIRSWLATAGFKNIRRVKFERYDYEALRARIIHGEGWIQIYADSGEKKGSF